MRNISKISIHIDLHKSKSNLWYLHVVDEFSRFSAASLIKN